MIRYLEDFEPGQKFGSGRLSVEATRIKSFAAEFDDDEEPEDAEEAEQAEEPQGDDGPDLDGVADTLKGYIAKLREESADRRVRLKAATDELGYVQDRLERLQRREVETLAAGRMIDPGDIWARHELADALEDGDVSPELVGKLIDGLPAHWRRQNTRRMYTEPVSGATAPADYRRPSWASAVRNPR